MSYISKRGLSGTGNLGSVPGRNIVGTGGAILSVDFSGTVPLAPSTIPILTTTYVAQGGSLVVTGECTGFYATGSAGIQFFIFIDGVMVEGGSGEITTPSFPFSIRYTTAPVPVPAGTRTIELHAQAAFTSATLTVSASTDSNRQGASLVIEEI